MLYFMLKWSILALELLVFFSYYFFGVNGINKINLLKNQENILQEEIIDLSKNITRLEEELKLFRFSDSQDFYKEKIAREQLQLGLPHEEIFILNKK